eukprot:CAMPEP_0179040074 /NCGR_PEP_ID=MMETSP0796-20121207/15460_1 /TAXON_ID=73915 /ORGANISM="Pyrodinium bahamense, Strain pbaha01" /LENGTH=135 /DNA_ID=CAMNT_0020736409 /DNA_START=18 /DNA_END=423 /DNA_ORIENTATION=-
MRTPSLPGQVGLQWRHTPMTCTIWRMAREHAKVKGELADQDPVILDPDVEGGQIQAHVADAPAGLQIVCVLVDGTSDLWSVTGHADEAMGEHLELLVGARVLGRIPIVGAHIVEDGRLRLADLHSASAVLPEGTR